MEFPIEIRPGVDLEIKVTKAKGLGDPQQCERTFRITPGSSLSHTIFRITRAKYRPAGVFFDLIEGLQPGWTLVSIGDA